MRAELERARREGRTFEEVWPFAILRVTRDVPVRAQMMEWRDVFAAQVPVWRAAYYGEPGPDLLSLLRPG